MNWLERARREIRKSVRRSTVNSAERNATAVMAVSHPALCTESRARIDSDGPPAAQIPEIAAALEDFEERAAIMEFDGGLSRDEAEREAAWALIVNRYRLH